VTPLHCGSSGSVSDAMGASAVKMEMRKCARRESIPKQPGKMDSAAHD